MAVERISLQTKEAATRSFRELLIDSNDNINGPLARMLLWNRRDYITKEEFDNDSFPRFKQLIESYLKKGVDINISDISALPLLNRTMNIFSQAKIEEVARRRGEVLRFLIKCHVDPWMLETWNRDKEYLASRNAPMAISHIPETETENRKLLADYMAKTMPQILKDEERTKQIILLAPDIAHTVVDSRGLSLMAHGILRYRSVAEAFLDDLRYTNNPKISYVIDRATVVLNYGNEEAYKGKTYFELIQSKYPGLLESELQGAKKSLEQYTRHFTDHGYKAEVIIIDKFIKKLSETIENLDKGKKGGFRQLTSTEEMINGYPQLKRDLAAATEVNGRLTRANAELQEKLKDVEAENERLRERNKKLEDKYTEQVTILARESREAKERIKTLEKEIVEEKRHFRFRRQK